MSPWWGRSIKLAPGGLKLGMGMYCSPSDEYDGGMTRPPAYTDDDDAAAELAPPHCWEFCGATLLLVCWMFRLLQ